VKFFFDNNVSWRLADCLSTLLTPDGFEIVALRRRFPQEIADEEWMPALGNEGGWTVVSGDLNIVRNPQRKKIWIESRLTTVFLEPAWHNPAFNERLRFVNFIRRWDDIAAKAREAAQGTALMLPWRGSITRKNP
jgi:hypothetical protein